MDRLVLQRFSPTGVRLLRAEDPIDYRRRVARRRTAIEPSRELARIRPRMVGQVTGDTGHRAVLRPALVPEELLAEGDLLRRERIVLRDVHGLFLQAERELELELSRAGRGGEDGRAEEHPDQAGGRDGPDRRHRVTGPLREAVGEPG